ncbi:hypothetical protein PENSPDRAFT_654355 [Peniophora sp. CONT]|nr:hypothetical protein PENSPDRAFT_654355 [Peniophora sp. CONT]
MDVDTIANLPKTWKAVNAYPLAADYPSYPPPIPQHLLTSRLWPVATTRIVNRLNDYERGALEWLGDSFLELAINLRVHERYAAHCPERSRKVKKELVSRPTLSYIALCLRLHRHLHAHSNSPSNGGAVGQSMMEDLLESIIGVGVYEGPDRELTFAWVCELFDPWIDVLHAHHARGPAAYPSSPPPTTEPFSYADKPAYVAAVRMFGSPDSPPPRVPVFPPSAYHLLCQALTARGAPEVQADSTRTSLPLVALGAAVWQWTVASLAIQHVGLRTARRVLDELRLQISTLVSWDELCDRFAIAPFVCVDPTSNADGPTRKQLVVATKAIVGAVILTHGWDSSIDWLAGHIFDVIPDAVSTVCSTTRTDSRPKGRPGSSARDRYGAGVTPSAGRCTDRRPRSRLPLPDSSPRSDYST